LQFFLRSLNSDQIYYTYVKINKSHIKVFILLLSLDMVINANLSFNESLIMVLMVYDT